MLHTIAAIVTATTVVLTQSVVFAQRSSPKPDRGGDYYSHTSDWEVKSSSLSCRSGPGSQYRVICHKLRL
jgi:hypothetical protein